MTRPFDSMPEPAVLDTARMPKFDTPHRRLVPCYCTTKTFGRGIAHKYNAAPRSISKAPRVEIQSLTNASLRRPRVSFRIPR